MHIQRGTPHHTTPAPYQQLLVHAGRLRSTANSLLGPQQPRHLRVHSCCVPFDVRHEAVEEVIGNRLIIRVKVRARLQLDALVPLSRLVAKVNDPAVAVQLPINIPRCIVAS